jgi:3-oxoacyl-[acyl-carrier protein] reductase
LSPSDGRVVLVSGGSRGIGATTVRRLAEDGWDVSFCHDHDEQAALSVEKAVSELGARVLAVQADLTAGAAVRSWAQRAEEELGPVQAVVSCAGITRDRPLALIEDTDWRAVIDTGLDGVFHLCRATLPAMMERRSGQIVAVSSVSGVYRQAAGGAGNNSGNNSGNPGGIVAFTRALASQTAGYGIRVNAVVPAVVESDLTAIWPEEGKTRLTEAIVLRRFGSAAEVADRVAFLLSDQAGDLTGRVLEVDGGISLGYPVTPGRPA